MPQPLTEAQWGQEVGDDVAALKLVQNVEVNTKHYVELLSRAVDECMPEPSSDTTYTSPRPKLRLLAGLTIVLVSKTTFLMS